MCGNIQTKDNTHLDKNRHTGFASRCIECKRIYEHDRWKNNKDIIYKKHREYATSERGKNSFKKALAKFRKTEKGKIANKKQHAKRRKLGFIKICDNVFPECIPVEWHHINNDYVIALPNLIHKEIGGYRDVNIHRKLALEWIEIFYPEEIYNSCLEGTSKLLIGICQKSGIYSCH
jgi:hypothetical protein